MEFNDKILTCQDCGNTFVFSADEQVFFRDKQFAHEPKRCKACRAKRGTGRAKVRIETATTCSVCGVPTTVPFKPTKGLPVMCRSCFQKLGNQGPLTGQSSDSTLLSCAS